MVKEVPLVIGTAGHIDHGKTTLVQALSGVNLDSREEEKRRGITIELGFTPLTLPDGRVVSLVDVPGHERLIRQMVAGASGLDAVMLVVAADEGVMPQTREHLDILGLLGVDQGLIVLTKADMVDEEMLEMARDDVAQFVKGTFLEQAPLVCVSSVTKQGIDDLVEALSILTKKLKPRSSDGAYFLPVDRVFAVAGFGTVVTGTSQRGHVKVGEELDLLPRGKKCKVRSLQVHGIALEQALAGQRTALCLTDIALGDVARGDVVASSGVYRTTDCLDVQLSLLPTERKPLTHWQRVRLHIGTSDLLAHVSLLAEKELAPGQTCSAQLVLEERIAVALGSRFVVRFYSPLRTIGGGLVTNPYGRKPGNRAEKLDKAEKIEQQVGLSTPLERLELTLEDLGYGTLPALAQATQMRLDEVRSLLNTLTQKKKARYFALGDGVALSERDVQRQLDDLKELLATYHARYPHQKGLALDEAITQLWREDRRKWARKLVEEWVSEGSVRLEEGILALPDFVLVDGEAFQKDKEQLKKACDARGFMPPTLDELRAELSWPEKKFSDLVDQLKKSGDVALLEGTFLMTREQIDQLIALVSGVEGGFALADVKNLTGASRKYTMPMMEHLDRKGITRRIGDKRLVLRRD